MIPLAANTFKECLQTGASRRPDDSDVKLPILFQTDTFFFFKLSSG